MLILRHGKARFASPDWHRSNKHELHIELNKDFWPGGRSARHPAEPRLLPQLCGQRDGHEAGHMQGQRRERPRKRPGRHFFCVTSVYYKRRTTMRLLSRVPNLAGKRPLHNLSRA